MSATFATSCSSRTPPTTSGSPSGRCRDAAGRWRCGSRADGLHAREALGFDDDPGGSEREGLDLVISDLKLPRLDGRELLCLVRDDARLARVPYIIFSSSNDWGDIQRCLGCGADAFVQKPVDYEAYLDCLQRVTRWALDGFAPSEAPPCVVGLPKTCACDQRGRLTVTPRTLCDGAIHVAIDGGGDRALLVVADGSTLRFWAKTADLEGVLRGTPLQLSAHGGFCRLEVADGKAHLEFGLTGEGRKTCAFPVTDMADALAWVRSLPSPHEPPDDAVTSTRDEARSS